MADHATPAETMSSKFISSKTLLMISPVALFFSYLLSPVLFMLALRWGAPFPNPTIQQSLEIFWFPISWYADAGFPGGKEYLDFLRWVSGM